MTRSALLLVFLGAFLLLFGLFAVTNFEIVWGKPLMGFAALLAGLACLWLVFRGDKKE